MIICLDDVVDALNGRGFPAAVENTGGGCMAVVATDATAHGWAALLGPGWNERALSGERCSYADTDDLFLTPYDHSPDDDPTGALVTTVRSTDVNTVTDLVISEVRRSCTVRIAAELLRHGADPHSVLNTLEVMA